MYIIRIQLHFASFSVDIRAIFVIVEGIVLLFSEHLTINKALNLETFDLHRTKDSDWCPLLEASRLYLLHSVYALRLVNNY